MIGVALEFAIITVSLTFQRIVPALHASHLLGCIHRYTEIL